MNQFLLYNSYIIGPFVNKNYQKKLSHQKTNKETNKQKKERKKETLIYLIFSFYLLATSWTFTFNWIYNDINNSVKHFWSWLDPKDFLWHAVPEKINSFFEHKIFFCVASSCFCRHEIFFVCSIKLFCRYQITFLTTSNFLFLCALNFCFSYCLECYVKKLKFHFYETQTN